MATQKKKTKIDLLTVAADEKAKDLDASLEPGSDEGRVFPATFAASGNVMSAAAKIVVDDQD